MFNISPWFLYIKVFILISRNPLWFPGSPGGGTNFLNNPSDEVVYNDAQKCMFLAKKAKRPWIIQSRRVKLLKVGTTVQDGGILVCLNIYIFFREIELHLFHSIFCVLVQCRSLDTWIYLGRLYPPRFYLPG